jgi:hypothetical protein
MTTHAVGCERLPWARTSRGAQRGGADGGRERGGANGRGARGARGPRVPTAEGRPRQRGAYVRAPRWRRVRGVHGRVRGGVYVRALQWGCARLK